MKTGGFRPRGTWQEKMTRPPDPRIVKVPPNWAKQMGMGKMLIATPRLVDALMRQVGEGKLVTVREIRERLARDFQADVTGPLTTGIFIRIAAEAAEVERLAGKEKVTPFWRVIREDGSLMEKLPGGVEAHSRFLKAEGHVLEPGKGQKSPRVKDFQKHLMRLNVSQNSLRGSEKSR